MRRLRLAQVARQPHPLVVRLEIGVGQDSVHPAADEVAFDRQPPEHRPAHRRLLAEALASRPPVAVVVAPTEAEDVVHLVDAQVDVVDPDGARHRHQERKRRATEDTAPEVGEVAHLAARVAVDARVLVEEVTEPGAQQTMEEVAVDLRRQVAALELLRAPQPAQRRLDALVEVAVELVAGVVQLRSPGDVLVRLARRERRRDGHRQEARCQDDTL